ncbi:MAG: flagellar biosynthesis protein FlhA [Candidatus Eremiobacteraeota bacterium]|nr:flagellar biosynthesis protein FlhA [Candidatus Eremiobacteraeota bacterium]MBV8333754.1 flagellar biosynthesis protein FlhA [Candidatus Eremiobacteraeota bacterium]MBV8435086.1 flagellar biosynthesis protein FlhA [Candidatus Eremiobacteraeota bacterium]MBV8721530.1 flagellar biosynthesis protein FlhA [Candidatus Eremiobacteraeota bacterium]
MASSAPVNQSFVGRVGQALPLVIAAGAVALVILMIVPIPAWLLDILLSINIILALVIIGTSLYTENALSFSVFPTLLLVVTLFRLSLNITATRQILLHGYAGEVINFFGQIVVGGNYAVGFVIFLILVIIQFVVITNGAGRVAEVAARFTLDAMPGKQLAIDGDLNAGLITEAEARQRRKDIQRSADFYGAMDGASKFVRGDAIAAVIIVAINTIGGFIVGVAQLGLSVPESLQRFTLLTVGEGIVTQVPALLISTATGIIVTRAANESDFGRDISRQLTAQPNAILIAGILAAVFGIAGLARWLLLPLAALMFVFYFYRRRQMVMAPTEAQLAAQKAATAAPKPAESVVPLLSYDPMELEIGFGLIPLVDVNQGGDLLERITLIRRHSARDLGIVVPPIRVRDNLQLRPNAYVVKIYGLEVAQAEVMVSRLLAMNPGTATAPIDGIATTEPAFGLPALWISEGARSEAEMAGYTVIDPTSVIATHLTEIIKSHAPDLLGRQETSALLDNVKSHYPVVVEELVPGLLTVGEVQRVLQNLLRERIPIRNLVLILETLADAARVSKDIDFLTEKVRVALARHISAEYAENGLLSVITVDPRLEALLAEAVRRGEDAYALLDPNTVARVYTSLTRQIAVAQNAGLQPIVLCSPSVRVALKRLTERAAPQLVVLSYSEIPPGLRVESIGQISTTDEAAPAGVPS